MGKRYRQEQLAREIQRSVGACLMNEIHDHVLTGRMITISGVDLSSDGSYASVYFTPFVVDGEDPETVSAETMAAFDRAKGVFRTQLTKDIRLRHAPELVFRLDKSLSYGQRIDALLDELQTVDNGEEAR